MNRKANAIAWKRRFGVAACALGAVASALLATGHPAAASNTSNTAISAFPVLIPGHGSDPASINDLIVGPDGALWFTWNTSGASTYGFASGLGRVTTSGVVTVFTAPTGWSLIDLTAGDGSLWLTETHGGAQYIGRWSTAGALVTEFPVAAFTTWGIAWGPDGALWFTGGTSTNTCGIGGGFIGRMTTGGAVTKFTLPPASGGGYNGADNIAPGPDGAMWFDLADGASIGRITTSGAVHEFALPGASTACIVQADQDLAAGPDGAMWLGAWWAGGVQRVSPAGTVTTYPVANVYSIAAGRDGNFYYTAISTGTVGRMTTTGQITGTWALPAGYTNAATVITAGPDGKLWIGLQGAVGQLDPVTPPPAPPPSPPPSTPPTVRVPIAGGSDGLASQAGGASSAPPAPALSGQTMRVAAAGAHVSQGSNALVVAGASVGVVLFALMGLVTYRRRAGRSGA